MSDEKKEPRKLVFPNCQKGGAGEIRSLGSVAEYMKSAANGGAGEAIMAHDHLWNRPPLTMEETIDKLAGANNEYRDNNLGAMRSVREGMKRNGKHPEVMFFGEKRDLDELIAGLESHQSPQCDTPHIVG